MTQTVLIAGAGGLFGRRAAEAFAAAGWTVRRFKRGTDMAAAAHGADVIVNAMNPPMYHNWAGLLPAITEEVIAAARASGATVLLPGNVYPYGREPGPWGPLTPHRPASRKGAIRAAIEARYREATAEGLRVIILRAGDFLDSGDGATSMKAFFLRDYARGNITTGGAPEVTRAYAYLPDLARAAVTLADRRAELPAFADVPFAGLAFSLQEFGAEVTRQTGRAIGFKRFPWWMMTMLSPVWELARELAEMRYLYQTPHRLDPEPFARLVPDFPVTPFADVVAAQIAAVTPKAAKGRPTPAGAATLA